MEPAPCRQAARVLIAGAAILAGAAFSTAHAKRGSPDETAMAIPRIEPPGSHESVALPEPLSPGDAARIRRIFVDQTHGRMADAEREFGQLENTLLSGPILADRYLGRFHVSTATELKDWLKRYSDEPDAPAIRALLDRRDPHHGVSAAPSLDCLTPAALTDPVPDDSDGSDPPIARNPILDDEIATRVQADDYSKALHLIGHTSGLKGSYGGWLRTEVARGLLVANRNAEALRVATDAWKRLPAGERVGRAAFMAGLAAWRLAKFNQARGYFEKAVFAPVSSASLRAAAAVWAARAAARLDDPDAQEIWLRRAAIEPLSFYSLIARAKLGWQVGLIPTGDTLSEADVDALAAMPQGQRAFALLQVGQDARAEQEFRCLWPRIKDDPALRRALLLVSVRARLTDLAAQIGQQGQVADGHPYDGFGFAVPRLQPAGGFRFNPALVYGIARAESNFDPHAVSPAGARGLMQIMPVTARSLTGNKRLAQDRLRDPGFNLELGQRWVQHLASDDAVDGDLISLLAGYNAGLGSLASWSEQIQAARDPLLFIELIPTRETRIFVKRALAYTWIYAARLGLPAPSLDEIAAGNFPRFTPETEGGTVLVSLH